MRLYDGLKGEVSMKTALLNIIACIETWQNTDPDLMDEQDALDSAEDTIMDVMRIARAAVEEPKG